MNLEQFEFEKVEGGYRFTSYKGDEEKVVIPDTFQGEPVVEIGTSSFPYSKNRRRIKEIILPKQLKRIHKSGFMYCDGLRKIELPEGLVELSENTFFGCNQLEEIIFSSTIQKVGCLSFYACSSLRKVIFKGGFIDLRHGFTNFSTIEEANLPAIKSIPKRYQCKLLANLLQNWMNLSQEDQEEISVFLKEEPTLQEELFLNGNSKIVSFLLQIDLPISLEDVNDFLEISVKEEHTAITAIFLDYKNKKFTKEEIEAQNQRVELVEMGLLLPTFRELSKKWLCKKTEEGITIQGYLKSDTRETIPKSLEDGTKIIDICVKTNFSPLEELTILADLTGLSPYAFRGCKTLRKVILPNTLKKFGHGCFNNCIRLESITFPENILSLSSDMFINCMNLKKVIFPSSITALENDTTCRGFFYGCKRLEHVVLPPNFTEIQERMFHGCTSLKELVIPDSVQSIGSYAFSGCKNLPLLVLPKNLKEVGNGSFNDCDSMKNEDGYILVHDIIYDYKGTEPEIQIPEGVTAISDFAFSGHEEMTTIHLPKSMKTIGCSAFNCCYALHTVTFEDMEDGEVHFDHWAIRDYMNDSDKMSLREITLPAKATYYKNSFEDFTVVTGGILLKDD